MLADAYLCQQGSNRVFTEVTFLNSAEYGRPCFRGSPRNFRRFKTEYTEVKITERNSVYRRNSVNTLSSNILTHCCL
jgi:hypothetical protein